MPRKKQKDPRNNDWVIISFDATGLNAAEKVSLRGFEPTQQAARERAKDMAQEEPGVLFGVFGSVDFFKWEPVLTQVPGVYTDDE